MKKTFLFFLSCFFASISVSAQPTTPGTPDLAQQVAQQGQTIQQLINYVQYLNRELGAIKQELILNKNIEIDTQKNPIKGNANAQVAFLEFSDYECPFCGRFAVQNKKMLDSLVTTGKVKKIFIDLPLTSIHTNAFKAAKAARCAGDQGKYWEMHDEMFTNQAKLTEFQSHAKTVGLDATKFDECLASNKHDAVINESIAFATSLNVNSTPTLALAMVNADGKLILNKFVQGGNIESEINALLEKAAQNAPKPATPAPAANNRRRN